MIGTDTEILGKDPELRIQTGGRPAVNVVLVADYLNMRRDDGSRIYTKKQIARHFKCSPRTITRCEIKAREDGLLHVTVARDNNADFLNEIEVDFDDECKRAVGTSFKDWIKSQRRVTWKVPFNFARKCWTSSKMFNRANLVRVADRKDRLGGQLAQKWLSAFEGDVNRFRNRLKHIRPLFTFLGREDINNKFFRMPEERAPRNIRTLSMIEFSEFPSMIEDCIEELALAMVKRLEEPAVGREVRLFVHLKTIGQMRTGTIDYRGKEGDDRGIWGIRKGSVGTCTLTMNGPEGEFRMKIKEKKSEYWNITHVPPTVLRELWEIYEKTPVGGQLFERLYKFAEKEPDEFLGLWREITHRKFGVQLIWHDLRKCSITWYYVLGVPLVRATKINVGWKSLDTAVRHYAHIDNLMKRTIRDNYKSNIPEWFSEGVEEFIWKDYDDLIEFLNTRIGNYTAEIEV